MTPGIVGETDLAGTTQSEYIFFDGARVARRDGTTGTGGVFYYFSDHLKTASVITDSAGVIKAESDYYPWGGELQFVNNDSNHYKFTGKERDSETQLDYFGARYYSNGLGRFVTPDWAAKPIAVAYADFSDPQTLNLSSYVRNIPTTRVDADGHCPAGGTNCKNVTVTADPPEQKAPPTDITITDPEKKTVRTGTGPIAHITFTVKVNGKGVDGVKITESNKDKLTINGKTINGSEKIEGKGETKDGGKFGDDVGLFKASDGSAKGTAEGIQWWNSVKTDKVNEQTVTMTFPDGKTCTCTETRNITNVDSQGKQTDYRLKTTQPVVKDPNAPK